MGVQVPSSAPPRSDTIFTHRSFKYKTALVSLQSVAPFSHFDVRLMGLYIVHRCSTLPFGLQGSRLYDTSFSYRSFRYRTAIVRFMGVRFLFPIAHKCLWGPHLDYKILILPFFYRFAGRKTLFMGDCPH